MLILTWLSICLALCLDYYFAEVRRAHPLVLFGNLAIYLQQRLNPDRHLKSQPVSDTPQRESDAVVASFDIKNTDLKNTDLKGTDLKGKSTDNRDITDIEKSRFVRLCGAIAWLLAVSPWVILSYLIDEALRDWNIISLIFAAVIVYFAIGWNSLLQHARAISKPLKAGDINAARTAVSMIVSRDSSTLDEQQISTAATESVLENGADAIFCALFWFLVLGVPGIVLYRLSNTLDAMWGYKNSQYLSFGWAAAKIDDGLNYLPARLTAWSYALMGNYQSARACWQRQGVEWKSPNAGPVMAAGAGAINTRLGGGAFYHGQWQSRPVLGPLEGKLADASVIESACLLVNRTLVLWVVVLFLLAML